MDAIHGQRHRGSDAHLTGRLLHEKTVAADQAHQRETIGAKGAKMSPPAGHQIATAQNLGNP